MDHVITLRLALKHLESGHPTIFSHPDFVWNMDKTDVTGVHGAKEKVFGSSETHYGGAKGTWGRGIGKHLTTVIATSASGHVIPPMLIFEGVYQMEQWFELLSSTVFKDDNGSAERIAKSDWFPADAVVVGTPRGSMAMETMPRFVQHFQKHVRKTVSPDKQVCLLIGGHASRNGHEWLEAFDNFNISAVQLPAHTTHFFTSQL